jgi:hypothetical protein
MIFRLPPNIPRSTTGRHAVARSYRRFSAARHRRPDRRRRRHATVPASRPRIRRMVVCTFRIEPACCFTASSWISGAQLAQPRSARGFLLETFWQRAGAHCASCAQPGAAAHHLQAHGPWRHGPTAPCVTRSASRLFLAMPSSLVDRWGLSKYQVYRHRRTLAETVETQR